jgi:hypothetical protein
MKMTQPVFDSLKSDLAIVADKLGIEPAPNENLRTMFNLLAIVSQCRAFDDNHPNFKSGRWARVLPYDGRNYCWYYDGGLNDSHIETALKKIKGDIFPKV